MIQARIMELCNSYCQFKGHWDAESNIPELKSSVGSIGDFYIVSKAGRTLIDGIPNWHVGSYVYFNGTFWKMCS